jgi:BirA family biotin operon repressor/biotin-[acetyl-CoA-carboxylase] ligase
MHLVKLDATDSTNQYLKELILSKTVDDFTVVVAKNQRKGKGQMGAEWQAKPGMNLTFSVLKKFESLNIADQFRLNVCVSLSILKLLKNLSVPDLSIKWPNDILSGSSKICGILIENIIAGQQITASVIGIGLNVNQTTFNTLTNVSSLKLLLGKTLNLDELLKHLLENIESTFMKEDYATNNALWLAYEKQLFRKDKPSTFKDANNEIFMGFIRNISPQGKLVIELEDAILKQFGLKEIKLLY